VLRTLIICLVSCVVLIALFVASLLTNFVVVAVFTVLLFGGVFLTPLRSRVIFPPR